MTSCHSISSSCVRLVGNHGTLDGETRGRVAARNCRRDYNVSSATDDDGAYMDDVGGRRRPDRPDCVPKIDLSWTHSDDDRQRNAHAPDHVTLGHVTRCGGRSRVVARRRRRKRRRAKLRTNHGATCTSPLTPRTPRREIVRRLDIAEVENNAKKQEVETEETGRVRTDDEGLCASKNDYCKTTTTNFCDVMSPHDVMSDRDVSFNSTSNASVMQYDADSPVTSPMTNMSTECVKNCQTGSAGEYAGAEIFHLDAESPSSLTNITQFPRVSAAGEMVPNHGGDSVCVYRKLERESSPSVAERLLCTLDCCNCCRLTLILYRRSAAPQ